MHERLIRFVEHGNIEVIDLWEEGQLQTFSCIEWECELYSGRPKARCYPFNLAGHRFRGKKRQVQVFHVL